MKIFTGRILLAAILMLSLHSLAAAQAEVTVSLNEQFFDALLDAIFRDGKPLEFPIARNDANFKSQKVKSQSYGFAAAKPNLPCEEKITLLRESGGVRTAARFRDGKIYAPIAFTGNYNPPLIGCVEFSGYAETNIELEFDKNKQILYGRAKVLNVNLNGTGGLGGTVLARLVQSSLDNKINPLEILRTDKLSFIVPVQRAGSLKMRAIDVRPEVVNGALNVRVSYEFLKF